MYSSILEVAHGIIQIGGAGLILILLFIAFGVLSAIIKVNRTISHISAMIVKCESWITYPMAAFMSYINTKTQEKDCCDTCASKKS